jgi:hypothetical protein
MKSVIIIEYSVRQQAGKPEFNIQYVWEFASRQKYSPDNVYDILLLLLLLGQNIIAVSYVETQHQ